MKDLQSLAKYLEKLKMRQIFDGEIFSAFDSEEYSSYDDMGNTMSSCFSVYAFSSDAMDQMWCSIFLEDEDEDWG